MSALSWAWFAVALALLGLIVVACVVMANVFRLITKVTDLVDGVTRQTVPMIGEAGTTVSLINQELGRVDGVLSSAEHIAQTTGQLVTVIQGTISSPLVKLSAFTWGLRRAVTAAAADGADGGGQPRRGRRRGRRR